LTPIMPAMLLEDTGMEKRWRSGMYQDCPG